MNTAQLLDFRPAVFKQNKSLGDFIEFHVYNYDDLQMERKRIRLKRLHNTCSTQRQYRTCINRMLVQLNIRLAAGWTPNGDVHDAREFTPVKIAIQHYLEDKGSDLRKASIVSYSSVCNIFAEWLESQNLDKLEVRLITQSMVSQFMDSLRQHKRFNNNTYNTYLKKYRACWNWFIEHGYCTENPFAKLHCRLKQTKRRIPIPPDTREKVLSYVRSSDIPNFEIVMHLIFSSLIRPTEIRRIQIKDISIKDACIHIPADNAKTHKERYVPITDACIRLLIPLLANGCPNGWYLLGKDLVPSETKCWNARFRKEWMKIRQACGLPSAMQLYSLKDSGIRELLESGMDIITVRDLAGHQDISTTNKYCTFQDKNMIQKVRASSVRL